MMRRLSFNFIFSYRYCNIELNVIVFSGKLMLRYNTLKNQWKYFSALPEPRNHHAAVYYKENIYVCGTYFKNFYNIASFVIF